MRNVTYFAYGSNMQTEHLNRFAPSARQIGRARLPDKVLVCNKASQDGSGKANLMPSCGDVVWGVLFEIASAELEALDKAEGGYERVDVQVWDEQTQPVAAQTYVSTNLTIDPVSYDWYTKLIIEGASEHRLPDNYIDYLKRLPSRSDPRDVTTHVDGER